MSGDGFRQVALPPLIGVHRCTSVAKNSHSPMRKTFRSHASASSSQTQSFDPEAGSAEVHEQAGLEAGGLQIVDSLCDVGIIEGSDRFELQQNLPLNHKVGKIFSYDYTIIPDDKWPLLCKLNACLLQFVGQGVFVYLFQKTPAPEH